MEHGSQTEAVQELRRRLYDYAEMVFDHFDDGIYITDEKAVTIYLNRSYEQISGLTHAEMIGRNMQELVDEGVISISGTLAVLRSGDSVTIEQSFRTGKRAIITSMPILDKYSGEDEIVMVLTVVRETTEYYRIKKELHRSQQQNRSYVHRLVQSGQIEPEIPDGFRLKDEVSRLEAGYIDAAYRKYGNVREAAAALGIDSSTFVRKRQRYQKSGLLSENDMAD